MTKVAFFHCCGTADMVDWFGQGVSLPTISTGAKVNTTTVAGLNGKTAIWGGSPRQDPFPSLLDPDIFDAKKIPYAAAMFPMAASITEGTTNLIKAITDLPAGQPWMMGGYSQGAAVCSHALLQGLQVGTTGALESRRSSFLGATMFGNPRRQTNYRGSVGGTWSGAFDVTGSTTGGHGSFPTTGTYRRLTSCDATKWQEFAAPDDIFTSCGDSSWGANWVAACDVFTGTASGQFLNYLPSLTGILNDVGRTFNLGNAAKTMTDAAGVVFSWLGGNGHTAYPFVPPVGNPDGTLTSYQIALKWLTAQAQQYVTAPILLPTTPTTVSTAGWSTTLTPPAA